MWHTSQTACWLRSIGNCRGNSYLHLHALFSHNLEDKSDIPENVANLFLPLKPLPPNYIFVHHLTELLQQHENFTRQTIQRLLPLLLLQQQIRIGGGEILVSKKTKAYIDTGCHGAVALDGVVNTLVDLHRLHLRLRSLHSLHDHPWTQVRRCACLGLWRIAQGPYRGD